MAQDLMVIKKETADLVLSKIQTFQKNGELDLPPNYSAANALKSAWLMLQATVDRNKRPALEVCTKVSIANALLDMVVQALNPAKKQCYFIVYGNVLALNRSYLGTKSVCLRVAPELEDIYAEVVYQDDELEYCIDKGRRVVTSHKQKLSNIDNSKIMAAYAVAIGKDGQIKRSELMTMAQIKQSWKQSPMKPVNDKGIVNPDSTHGKFPDEMSKRTVTARLAKHIIGSNTDSDLLINSVRRSDDEAQEAEVQAEIDENANQEFIDVEPERGLATTTAAFRPAEMTDEEKAEIAAMEAAQDQGPGY